MHVPQFPVVMAAIAKNEGPFVAEWIAYHYLLGVEHFVIYDNASTDDTVQRLAPFINTGLVTLVHWPLFPGQIEAYQHAVTTFGPMCDWMGFLDLDEFLALPEGATAPGFLATLPDEADELVLFWRMFGHGGHRARPEGLMIENFTRCDPQTSQISKCFVRPSRVTMMFVHHAATRHRRSVDENGRPVPQVWMHEKRDVSGERATVHHYFTRSYDDYAAKIARGQADGRSEKKLEPFDKWDYAHEDARLARFAPAVRALLALVAERGASPTVYGNLTRISAIASPRNFMVASQAAIGAAQKTFGDDQKTVKLQHSHHGTGMTAPPGLTDDRFDALFAGLCEAVPGGREIAPAGGAAGLPPPTPGTLVEPASLSAAVWIAVAVEVTGPGHLDCVLTGLRRDGSRIRQTRKLPLVTVGRALALLVLNDETLRPEALDLVPSDPANITLRHARVFARN